MSLICQSRREGDWMNESYFIIIREVVILISMNKLYFNTVLLVTRNAL